MIAHVYVRDYVGLLSGEGFEASSFCPLTELLKRRKKMDKGEKVTIIRKMQKRQKMWDRGLKMRQKGQRRLGQKGKKRQKGQEKTTKES